VKQEKNTGKHILITGGAGYIGSVAAQVFLEAGHRVSVVDTLWFDKNVPLCHRDNPNYTFYNGNIDDSGLLGRIMEGGIDYIMHAAAVVGEPASRKFPELTYKVNYESSVKLIKNMQNTGVKGLIFLSTCSNYGMSDGMATEDSPLKPLSLYAETKVNVEKYLMESAKGPDWVICRLSTVYGISPRMRFDLTVNDFTMNAYTKKYLDIFLPESRRPYIHVSDVAFAAREILKNFEKVKNNVFNIGFNKENYRKIEIARAVKELMPETNIDIVKKGSDLRDYQVDFSKLQKFLDIKNRFSVKKGIGEILRSLKDRSITGLSQNHYYNTTPDLGAWQMAKGGS